MTLTALLLALAIQTPGVTGPVGDRLDSVMEAAQARGFHGVVLVTQRGQTILHKGYGLANRATGLRFSPNTLVQIGSGVKDFTRVAIYQLVERGRLSLADTLGRFVRDLPGDRRGITMRQLLDHRAGLPLGAGGGDQRALTRAELLRELRAVTLLSAPGSAERYSNMGYALLALVVEELGGKPFDRYVADEILRPLGLRETGSHLAGFDRARVAHGYAQGDRDIGVILDLPHDDTGHLYQLRGNGGYLSTLENMLRFYRAVQSPELLREPAHRRDILATDGPAMLAGSDNTSYFQFANFPGAGVEILVATNHAAYDGRRVTREILPVLGIRQGGGGDGPRVVATGPAEARLPATGQGRTVAAYLEAFNSGDTAAMRRFLTAHGDEGPGTPPVAVRLERYQDMWSNLGRLTLRSVTPTSDGLSVVAVNAEGETVTLGFIVDAAPPHRLRGVRVEVG